MLFILFLACGGAALETRVDELRVMAIKTVPAEFSPFEATELNLLIPNPTGKSAQVLFWTCTNFGDGCLERDYYAESSENWGSVQSIDNNNPVVTSPLELPPVISGIVSESPADTVFGATFLWALACEDGLCPIIDQWLSGTPDIDAMNDPFSLMKELPIEGTSLAFRPLIISNRPDSARIQHPLLELTGPEEITLSGPNDNQDISFDYTLNRIDPESDGLFYAYATQGGFQMNDRFTSLLREESGSFEASWFGTDDLESGEALLMIILENGDGGISFWTNFTTIE